MKTCRACGLSFDAGRVNQRYCGFSCHEVARNQRRRAAYARGEVRPRFVLHGLISGKPVMVHAEKTVGLMAWCPCGDVAGFPRENDLPEGSRQCVTCGTVVTLNHEEVEAINAGLITA